MPVEDDADLAGMFDTADHALPAIYRSVAEGDVACGVILDTPVEQARQLGDRGVVLPAVSAMVPRRSLPERPAEGRQLVIDGITYIIAAPPEADISGAVWRLALRRA